MRAPERAWAQGGAEGENLQADSPLSVEPNTGLNLMTHKILTWAETKSWTLNQLSYLGTLRYSLFFIFYFFKDFIYLKDRGRERERANKQGDHQTEGEGEPGSPLSREPCGTRSQDPEIMTWTKGRCLTTEPPWRPLGKNFLKWKVTPMFSYPNYTRMAYFDVLMSQIKKEGYRK